MTPADTRLALLLLLLLVSVALTAGACERDGHTGEPADEKVELVEAGTASASAAWRSDHDAALADALAAGKPVIIDFGAEWCAPCVELEQKTFAEARVARIIEERFVAVHLDGTESTKAIQPFMDRYAVESFPTVVFIDSSGRTLDSPRFDDFVPPEQMLRALAQVR